LETRVIKTGTSQWWLAALDANNYTTSRETAGCPVMPRPPTSFTYV
jgi:hypothetical protein